MIRQQVLLLRVALVVLTLVAVLTQVLIVPWMAATYAAVYPQAAYLARPYAVVVVVAILGFEVAAYAAWRVLAVAEGADEAGESVPARKKYWATVMAAGVCFVGVLLAGACLHAAFIANVGGPATIFGALVSLALLPVAVAVRRSAINLSISAGEDPEPLGHAR